MKPQQRLIITILSLCLLLCMSAPALAAEDAATAANELFALGLFRGTENGFELEAPCDRVQGAVLFARLLGITEADLAQPAAHPFQDIPYGHWAAPYLGFLYSKGLTYGSDAKTYGTGEMLPDQFATLCLRALGYTEGAERSDFHWEDGLNYMVEQHIISGNLRNRLRSANGFTRGDAVILAQQTLAAKLKDGNLTLLQQLAAAGVVDAALAGEAEAGNTALTIAYPAGMFDAALLRDNAAQNGLRLTTITYDPRGADSDSAYLQARLGAQAGLDLCILPYYQAQGLRDEGLLQPLDSAYFPSAEVVITPLQAREHWLYNSNNRRSYAVPLAFESPCLYYNSALVTAPEWRDLFRGIWAGSVYMPSDPALLFSLALQYHHVPFDTTDNAKLEPALRLLAEQIAEVPAYLQEHMLDIAEQKDARLGVLWSRDLAELDRRKQAQEDIYGPWQVSAPGGGMPLIAYYAVLPQGADLQAVQQLLQTLLQPRTAAQHAQASGYLPTATGADAHLSGSLAAAYPPGNWQRHQFLDSSPEHRAFQQQTVRNAWIRYVETLKSPRVTRLDFHFYQDEAITLAYRIDITEQKIYHYLPEEHGTELQFVSLYKLYPESALQFQKDCTRLGLTAWKEFSDGPADGATWSMEITCQDGQTMQRGGYGYPLFWPDLAAAVLQLCGADILPQ